MPWIKRHRIHNEIPPSLTDQHQPKKIPEKLTVRRPFFRRNRRRKDAPSQTKPPSSDVHPPSKEHQEEAHEEATSVLDIDEASPPTVSKTTTRSTTETESKPPTAKVHFDIVQVRTYQAILGDNPNLDVPLSIGWQYNEGEPRSVDSFEACKRQDASDNDEEELEPLELSERRARLLWTGYTKKQLQQEEYRRKVQIAMEWSYRFDHPDGADIPCPLANSDSVIKRFIL